MIELRNICKRYGLSTLALRDLSFKIDDQEFLVIYGPSGAGKTTTLKIIAGIVKPTSGDILRDGHSIADLAPESRDMAMAFENYALYSHMSVYENLAFPLKARGMPKKLIDQRVRETAKILQIDQLLDRRPGFLSGGQRQRVSLGRAIIRPANIYLLDEPIGHLDAKLRHRMRGELKAMSADMNATIALTTTSSREALALGDRIAILKNGRLEQIGTPYEIYHQPANEFVASFVGEPPMSFLDIEPCQDNGILNFRLRGISAHIPVPDQLARRLNGEKEGYRLGVRASEITISGSQDPQHRVPGQVYILEPTGHSNIISVKVGDGLLRVVTAPSVCPSPNETVWLSLDAGHMHLFYKQRAICHPTRSRNEMNGLSAGGR